MDNRLAVNFNQRVWDGEVSQVAAVCTSMLPLVNVAGGDWPFTDEPVDTLFTSITNVLDFYSRNLATNSGHALIIEESGLRLNPDSGRSKPLDQLLLSAHCGHSNESQDSVLTARCVRSLRTESTAFY